MKKDIKLARLLHYILGRRPDEFGLVPDAQGYVAVKDLITILNEEKWSRVRPAHLEALPYRLPQAGIEMDQNRIRASDRVNLPEIRPCRKVPKELFVGVRRKAYTAVARDGLAPQQYPRRVVLFADLEMARRVGRRRDAEPLVVTVQTTVAQRTGIQFERFGESVFLAARIPVDCCRLPAPPRPVRVKHAEGDSRTRPSQPEAGSYTLDWERLAGSAPPPKPSPKKSKQWRRQRQRLRRLKQRAPDDR